MSKKEQAQVISDSADPLFKHLPKEVRAKAKAHYLEVMSSLNEEIDRRLEQMVEEVVPIVNLYLPHSPGDVQQLVMGYCSLVREFASAVINAQVQFSNHAVRALVTETLRDSIDYCSRAATEMACKSEELFNRKAD